MFSCMSGSDLATAVAGDGSAGGETIDRILAEAAKLKRKCKSLRVLLLETETKRSEEKEYYEQVISELKKELDTSIADIEAKNYIQLQHLENHRSNEMDCMANELMAARNETSMQGALIISMTHKITALENELQMHTDKKFSGGDGHEEYVAGLMERVTTAEAALAKLRAIRQPQQLSAWKCNSPSTASKDSCKGCSDLQQENAELRARLQEAQASKPSGAMQPSSAASVDLLHEKQKLCDQLAYFKEENSRLERQVELIRRDLEARAPATYAAHKGPAGSPRADLERFIFRPSEKERLQKELADSHKQVAELKGTVQELILTKASVEQAVRSVLLDNEQLTHTVDTLTAQLQQAQRSPRP